MNTFDTLGFWALAVIAIGEMVSVPIIVWRTNAHYPQIRRAKLKWACSIAWGELFGVAFLCSAVNSLLGYSASGNLWTFEMICMILSLVLLVGPVTYFLQELGPLKKARRQAQKHARQAARRQPRSNETGEVEV